MWVGIKYGIGRAYWMSLTRLDTAGHVLVTKQVQQTTNQLEALPDGGCLLAGENIIARLDATGKQQWAKTLPFAINSFALLPTGGNVFIGSTGLSPRDGMIAGRLSATGDIEWAVHFMYGPRVQDAYDRGTLSGVTVLPDGKLVLVAHRQTEPKLSLIGLGSAGQIEWSKDIVLGSTLPEYNLADPKLKTLADGTVLLALAPTGGGDLILAQFTATGELLRAKRMSGLKMDVGGVALSSAGNVVAVGYDGNAYPTTARLAGLFLTELDAHWQPQPVRSLEADPVGHWLSDYGMVLSADGAYRYALGHLIAPVNGGVPRYFRLLKTKTAGGKLCSSTDQVFPVRIEPVHPMLETSTLELVSTTFRQGYDMSLGIDPYNMVGKPECLYQVNERK